MHRIRSANIARTNFQSTMHPQTRKESAKSHTTYAPTELSDTCESPRAKWMVLKWTIVPKWKLPYFVTGESCMIPEDDQALYEI